jgi:hypothetical protein
MIEGTGIRRKLSRLSAISAAATAMALCQAMAQGARPLQRPSPARLQEDMQRLDWMVGKWQGSGWTESATRGRREFSYSLNVGREFGGLLLAVDGVGYSTADTAVSYAEQLLISGIPPGVVLEPPGSYLWQESGRGVFLRGNDAQGSGRSLRVGLPLLREDCDWIIDESRRTYCRTGGEPVWSRATISLNDAGEWVEIREWQVKDGDNRNWHTYLSVVLQRVTAQ